MGKQDFAKQKVARQALAFVQSGMVLGLGSGSTMEYFLTFLGQKIKQEQGRFSISGLATSSRIAHLALKYDIALVNPDFVRDLDLAIDGVDEIDPQNNLIKGGGGALLREKIAARIAKKFLVIADASKSVKHLGQFALPVEIIPFAHQASLAQIMENLGQFVANRDKAVWRVQKNNSLFVTDEGNYILDLHCRQIYDAHGLARYISAIPGIVEHGLFIDFAPQTLIV